MEATRLPLVRAPPDALRHGFRKASEDVRPVHPVQLLENHYHQNAWETKMKTVENIYGKAAAMRLRTEKAIMEKYTRMPGLPSSRVGLDTITGKDEEMEFSDIFSDPMENMDMKFKVHDSMEIKFGIL